MNSQVAISVNSFLFELTNIFKVKAKDIRLDLTIDHYILRSISSHCHWSLFDVFFFYMQHSSTPLLVFLKKRYKGIKNPERLAVSESCDYKSLSVNPLQYLS